MKEITTRRSEHLGQILEQYMRGGTPRSIADSLGITKQLVESTLQSFRADYLACLSIRGIIPRYENPRNQLDDINKDFFESLSHIDEPLTNEEMLYCAFYVSTGNSVSAIKESGLDIGLKVNERATKEIYDKNCLLRSEVLKRKRNVQEEIRRLQKERSEYREATKDRILEMHMEMIEQLMEEGDPKNRTTITKLLDQVNKMQGNYSIEIKSGEVTADDVLDGMLEAAGHEMPENLKRIKDNPDDTEGSGESGEPVQEVTE